MIKLTKREKKLLMVLLSIIVIYGYMQFIIDPQLIKIKNLKTSIDEYELVINSGNNSYEKLGLLNSKYDKNQKKINTYSKSFFSSLEQSTLILLIDNLTKDIEIETNSIKFSQYREEEIANSTLNAISASIPFSGSYNSLLKFLNNIRKNKEKIIIKDINILNDGNNLISGNIVLDFYSVSPLGAQKLSSSISNGSLSFKENPFESYERFNDNSTDYLENLDLIYNDEKDSDYLIDNYSTESSKKNEHKDIKKELLYGFEDLDMFFVGNPKSTVGIISLKNHSKQGSSSVKIQYNFIRKRESSVGNFVFDNIKPYILMQPEYISLLVYSYEKSDHKIGFILKDSLGNEYTILLSDGINWIGWETLETNLPENITYPVEIQRIFVQNSNIESKINGAFLLDNMEAGYRNIFPD